ncbi:MAG: sodium:proton antiporter [Puniceicoccaceae bacterium]|nr:MAG: sodium:proton antiporter [Puniceicoccaceae bacterium]
MSSSANRLYKSIPLWFFLLALVLSWWAGQSSSVVWSVQSYSMDVRTAEARIETLGASAFIPVEASQLRDLADTEISQEPPLLEEWVIENEGSEQVAYRHIEAQFHRGAWSLFPAFVTIVLCFLTREPITALLGGIVSGALLLGTYDLLSGIMIPGLTNSSAALVVLLYLGLLGGMLGIWSRNGAARAFAESITRHFVRGPKTAKLAAWALGVFFFQGGTISTLLVGTTIKPVADKEKISHEELSYIVDSTASPIAVLLPFNAWPFYVQGLIFVGGVSVLATEAARVTFFFTSIPLFFYAILAITFTFLLSIDRLPFIGASFKEAIRRSRETGKLDRPGSTPLQASKTFKGSDIPEGYQPAAFEFIVPLVLIIGIAVGTYLLLDSPNVLWAFAVAVFVAAMISRLRGMSLKELIEGVTTGLQGVVYGAVILLLAVVIGGLSRETGGGLFLVDSMGGALPYQVLPLLLFVLTVVIAFSTGTSWGTFAVTFPLAMPLAWSLAQNGGLEHPVLFIQICFAAVINGSVFGDQCSPISDTTVLSSLATGCDLMDHVKTQIIPSSVAAGLAIIGWTTLTLFV